MSQRSGLLTGWLLVLLAHNVVRVAQGIFYTGIAFTVSHAVDWESPETKATFEKSDITKEEFESVMAEASAWSIAFVAVRLVSAATIAWLFLSRKVALWCYCGSVAGVFVVNMSGGSAFWETSIDLGGLLILTGLLFLSKPPAWRRFK